MLNYLKQKFAQLRIVEVMAPKAEPLDGAGKAALATLKDHPGFEFLINRLRLQRATLQTALTNREHASLNDVITIQAGIRWLTWLENQFLSSVGSASTRETRSPNEDEVIAFQQALAAIEGIGK